MRLVCKYLSLYYILYYGFRVKVHCSEELCALGNSKRYQVGQVGLRPSHRGAMLCPWGDVCIYRHHGQACVPPEGACLSNLCESTTRAGGSQNVITDNFLYFHMSLKVFKLYWNYVFFMYQNLNMNSFTHGSFINSTSSGVFLNFFFSSFLFFLGSVLASSIFLKNFHRNGSTIT